MHRNHQNQSQLNTTSTARQIRCERCHRPTGNCDRDKHAEATLRSLENARRAAFEAQELERWDGLS